MAENDYSESIIKSKTKLAQELRNYKILSSFMIIKVDVTKKKILWPQ